MATARRCLACRKPLLPVNPRVGGRRRLFCDKVCTYRHAAGSSPAPTTCRTCGKKLPPRPAGAVGRPPHYCSPACRPAAQVKACVTCGKPLIGKQKAGGRKTCSRPCRLAWAAVRRGERTPEEREKVRAYNRAYKAERRPKEGIGGG